MGLVTPTEPHKFNIRFIFLFCLFIVRLLISPTIISVFTVEDSFRIDKKVCLNLSKVRTAELFKGELSIYIFLSGRFGKTIRSRIPIFP